MVNTICASSATYKSVTVNRQCGDGESKYMVVSGPLYIQVAVNMCVKYSFYIYRRQSEYQLTQP